MLTLGGAAATATPTALTPGLRELNGVAEGSTAPEICNLYQSPSNARASICSAASYGGPGGVTNGYFRGTLAGSDGYVEVRVNTTVYRLWSLELNVRGIWTDAASVQFRVCGTTGGCGPWK